MVSYRQGCDVRAQRGAALTARTVTVMAVNKYFGFRPRVFVQVMSSGLTK